MNKSGVRWFWWREASVLMKWRTEDGVMSALRQVVICFDFVSLGIDKLGLILNLA